MESSSRLIVIDDDSKTILVSAIYAFFEYHGLSFKKDLSLYRSGQRRCVIGCRCVMVILNAFSMSIAAAILVLHFTYNRGDIEALCMWLALHAMVLTSAVIYIRTLFRISTMRNYIQALDELMNEVTNVKQSMKSDYIESLHSMCNRSLLLSYTSQLLEVVMLVLHMSFGNHKKIFYDDLASVYNLKDSRMHYFGYVVLSVVWVIAGHSFLRIYNVLVAIVCVALHKSLQILVDSKCVMTYDAYLRKHKHICYLIREADSLFSPFFFVKLVRSFVIIVVFSRFLKTVGNIWDNLFIIYAIGSSLMSMWVNTSLASRLNEKIYTSLDPPHSVRYGDSILQDQMSLLLYIARLSSNTVGLTMWGFFSIGKGLIFTTVGTMITYIIILWQFG